MLRRFRRANRFWRKLWFGSRLWFRFGFRFRQGNLARDNDRIFIPVYTVTGGEDVARMDGFDKERLALKITILGDGHKRQRAEPVIDGKAFGLCQCLDRHGGNAHLPSGHGPIISQFRDVIRRGTVQRAAHLRLKDVDIPADYPHTLYYKANYQPLGPAPRFSIPQWYASILSRLRFGAWNMSQVRMPLADQNRVTFNSIEGEHLVDWTLEEGEEVVFSYRHFVAMNGNIELRTVISLRVATLLLGRIVFHTARC